MVSKLESIGFKAKDQAWQGLDGLFILGKTCLLAFELFDDILDEVPRCQRKSKDQNPFKDFLKSTNADD